MRYQFQEFYNQNDETMKWWKMMKFYNLFWIIYGIGTYK